MSGNLNQCNFIGNLGADPEMKFMPNGKAVTNFSIAVTEKWMADGERREKTEWVRVVVYGKLAENCAKLLSKGKSVFITGKMQTRQWEDRDGNKRYTTEIVANQMQLLEKASHNPNSAEDDGYNGPPEGMPEDMDGEIPF